MEKQSGLSELSVISWVSAVEGCLLSGITLQIKGFAEADGLIAAQNNENKNYQVPKSLVSKCTQLSCSGKEGCDL